MHDIRFIRDNPEGFDRALKRRVIEPQARRVIALDEKRRAAIQALEAAQARRNAASKEIGEAKKNKDEDKAKGLLIEVAALKESIPGMEVEGKKASKELDDALAEKTRLMRNFGFVDFDRVVYLGTNGKMTEVCAAMGLTSLESMDEVIRLNRDNYESYRSELEGLPGVRLIDYNQAEKPNYHYVVVEVDASRSPLDRDELVKVLHAENVLARKYFWPGCHRMEPYKSLFPNAYLLLPNTEFRAAQIMVLPTGQSVSKNNIAGVCEIIKAALAQAEQLKPILKQRGPKVKPPVVFAKAFE